LLVKKGIAGFIIFGGRLEELRRYVRRLQEESALPLIIASDLERGLGQQVKGGTQFPPAMALARATIKEGESGHDLPLLRKAFTALAGEAAYAGINTIFAPVLDINTNPKNPIIAARAFGEDEKTVSLLGSEMIRSLQKKGIAACAKHFPGHGDTEVDSHIRLPVINRELIDLKRSELRPFKRAIESGVRMIMLGHLSVPALDPSGIPVSFSTKAVQFLRKEMNYGGIVITDAMNMGGIGKYSEEKASFMALDAGADVILHPTDAERVVSYMEMKKKVFDAGRLANFRGSLLRFPADSSPDFDKNRKLSETLTEKAIRSDGRFSLKKPPLLVILNDEDDERGAALIRSLKKGVRSLRLLTINRASKRKILPVSEDASLIVAVFSETKGWKGGTGNWLYQALSLLEKKTELFISFGSPYLLDGIEGAARISAYWDSTSAQEAVARLILKKYKD
jgi:beta-glucosidase-like glycosyl hydrolase